MDVVHLSAEDILVRARVSRREHEVVPGQVHDRRGRGQRGVEHPFAVDVEPYVDLGEAICRVTELRNPDRGGRGRGQVPVTEHKIVKVDRAREDRLVRGDRVDYVARSFYTRPISNPIDLGRGRVDRDRDRGRGHVAREVGVPHVDCVAVRDGGLDVVVGRIVRGVIKRVGQSGASLGAGHVDTGGRRVVHDVVVGEPLVLVEGRGDRGRSGVVCVGLDRRRVSDRRLPDRRDSVPVGEVIGVEGAVGEILLPQVKVICTLHSTT